MELYINCISIFKRDQKKLLLYYIILAFLGMLLEVLSITFVIPLIKLFLDVNFLKEFPKLTGIIFEYFNYDLYVIDLDLKNKIVILGTIALFIIFLIKNCFLTYVFWIQAKILYQTRKYISYNLFTKYLHLPYISHLNRHSSDFIRILIEEVLSFVGGIKEILVLITELLVLFGIAIVVFLIEPRGALIIVSICIFAATIFYNFSKKKNVAWGNQRLISEKFTTKYISQFISGIKEIKMSNKEEFFLKKYYITNSTAASMERNQFFFTNLPRIFMEMVLILGMIILVLMIISRNEPLDNIIVAGGFFVAVSIRIIPSINRILTSLQNLKYRKANFELILKEFNLKNLEESKLEINKQNIIFTKKIEFKNLKYKYPNSKKEIFGNLNITIENGSIVGLIGNSGEGKSTLINLLSGLLKPTSGEILVDGTNIESNITSWQRQIGYIPQKIFISDETLEENIAFGISKNEIDPHKLEEVIKASQLSDFVKNSSGGPTEILGETGDKISGGQIQRIAIARSLYINPKLLILDESTNSLDLENANKIIQSLIDLKNKLTIIIIAHDKKHLEKCNLIYEIKKFNVTRLK